MRVGTSEQQMESDLHSVSGLYSRAVPIKSTRSNAPALNFSMSLKVPHVDHETDVEKWFKDRHHSEKSVPQATVVGSFT